MARPRTFDESDVLARARDLFWQKGFAATSISDLERATGLKRTSLYAAFGSKQELYLRTLAEYQQMAGTQIDRTFNSPKNGLENIRNLLQNSIEQAYADPHLRGCFLSNAASERGGQCPTTTGFLNGNREKMIERFQKQLRNADFGGDATATANYLFVLYSGLMNIVRTGADKKDVLAALETGLIVLE